MASKDNCWSCGGTKTVAVTTWKGSKQELVTSTCPTCRGKGWVDGSSQNGWTTDQVIDTLPDPRTQH